MLVNHRPAGSKPQPFLSVSRQPWKKVPRIGEFLKEKIVITTAFLSAYIFVLGMLIFGHSSIRGYGCALVVWKRARTILTLHTSNPYAHDENT